MKPASCRSLLRHVAIIAALTLACVRCPAVSFGKNLPAQPEQSRWSEVNPGMTRDAVVEKLGQPLMRQAGRGLEVWIFDNGASVTFVHGRVDYFTVPETTPVRTLVASVKPKAALLVASR